MDQIILCSNRNSTVTTISNTFIKKYMMDANGSYIKFYLFLSMCIQNNTQNLSISFLADSMDSTEKDIYRAFSYWEKTGLLNIMRNSAGVICSVELIEPDFQSDYDLSDNQSINDTITSAEIPETAATTYQESSLSPDKAPAETTTSTIIAPDTIPAATSEQTERLSNDEQFSWICLIVENYLKRPLQPAEIELITYLYDTASFSTDLILHLYEYCCSLEKTNVKYVQKVALSWAEAGIKTPEEAQNISKKYNELHNAVSKAFALSRTLAPVESQYVSRWENDFGFELGAIIEACNRTMLTIHKADFKYADGILANWHKQGAHTLAEIKECDNQYELQKRNTAHNHYQKANTSNIKPNQFQSFQQRSSSTTEMSELEKKLLNR